MLENLDKLRKAPQPVKERLVSVITVSFVVVITAVWFLFSIHVFFKHTVTLPTPSTPAQTQTAGPAAGIEAPFAL